MGKFGNVGCVQIQGVNFVKVLGVTGGAICERFSIRGAHMRSIFNALTYLADLKYHILSHQAHKKNRVVIWMGITEEIFGMLSDRHFNLFGVRLKPFTT